MPMPKLKEISKIGIAIWQSVWKTSLTTTFCHTFTRRKRTSHLSMIKGRKQIFKKFLGISLQEITKQMLTTKNSLIVKMVVNMLTSRMDLLKRSRLSARQQKRRKNWRLSNTKQCK
jgi:hypothetical protein